MLKFAEGGYEWGDVNEEAKKRMTFGPFKGFRMYSVVKSMMFALQAACQVLLPDITNEKHNTLLFISNIAVTFTAIFSYFSDSQ